jgi:RNA polymerase sigma-70 factor (ECF subfamily)
MHPPAEEEALIERARRGDSVAFETLVVAYQSLAFRTAFVIVGDAADAEEAAQDAFVKAYRALGRFRRGEPFRPWLLTIVANEARNRRRARRRRTALALREAEEPGAPAQDPEDVALATERRERLLTAVEQLRDDDRDILACRYFLDLSEKETAAALGIARGTVKSKTHRALVRLQKELA